MERTLRALRVCYALFEECCRARCGLRDRLWIARSFSRCARVVGVDLSEEAIRYAADHYRSVNQRWLAGSCTQLPFADATFDTVVAFEVIEHLPDWPKLLLEVRRVLKSDGVFLVSTPNKIIYSETRGDAGPNPFHEHEFEYAEFRAALTTFFPHVEIVFENHGTCVVFESESANISASAILESRTDAQQATFYIAICSQQPVDVPSFVYVPKPPNVLRQRGVGIERLEDELQKKTAWLLESQRDHAELVRLHEEQTRDLEARNIWAAELDMKLKSAGARIAELQQELQEQQRGALAVADAYEAELSTARKEVEARTVWARSRGSSAGRSTATAWRNSDGAWHSSIRLRPQLSNAPNGRKLCSANWSRFRHRLHLVSSSRWFKLGRMVNLGPELTG